MRSAEWSADSQFLILAYDHSAFHCVVLFVNDNNTQTLTGCQLTTFDCRPRQGLENKVVVDVTPPSGLFVVSRVVRALFVCRFVFVCFGCCSHVCFVAEYASVGTEVDSVCWSAHSQRLCVLFRDEFATTSLVALYHCQPGLVLSFRLIGYIRAPPVSAEKHELAGYLMPPRQSQSQRRAQTHISGRGLFDLDEQKQQTQHSLPRRTPQTTERTERENKENKRSTLARPLIFTPQTKHAQAHDDEFEREHKHEHDELEHDGKTQQQQSHTDAQTESETQTHAQTQGQTQSVNRPIHIAFQKCEYGAKLGICWSQGRFLLCFCVGLWCFVHVVCVCVGHVSVLPLYFRPHKDE